MSYLILAQSEVTARPLGAWLELVGEPPLGGDGNGLADERVLCSDNPESRPGRFVEGFRRLASDLANKLSQGNQIPVVLVDRIQTDDMSAVGSANGWNRLVTLLILAFPEVRWVFGVSSGVSKPSGWEGRHGLASLFGPLFDPLFDGLGLRAHIRELTAKTSHQTSSGKPQQVAPLIPQRSTWAVALDDEPVYAYLHGYIAYRYGFRAFPVHTQALGDHLLKASGVECPWRLDRPELTLEDFYLGFPDKTPDQSLSSLKARNDYWKRLKDAEQRNFISSGHGRGDGGYVGRENRAILSELRLQGRGGRQAAKPIPGIFALWQELKLDRSLRNRDDQGKLYRGTAPGFFWPPDERRLDHDANVEAMGHSAPGLLLLVAECLVSRAEALLESAHTVKDAVRGAVLATDALELLGPMTPTTARDALELKHRFEALAECQFGGVQYNLQLDDRFAEIQRDMRMLGRWYGPAARQAALTSGELTIVSRLMTIYDQHEEIDEAEVCRQRIRTLHRKVWFRQNRGNPMTWFVWLIRAYIEYLLGSLTRFTIAAVLWVAGLTGGFKLLKHQVAKRDSVENLQTLGQAISSFFGTEPLSSSDPLWIALTIVATVSGFLHLGIFISQTYANLARK
jgi:hypothetical protein